jgi:hypothetical protein
LEFLRATFLDELQSEANTSVEDGRIRIRSYKWSPEEVLAGMLTAEAIDSLFGDWIQERKEDRIAAAEELLKEYNQTPRFQKLTEAYERGSVTPFIGAGLSIPSGYPGWTAYLYYLQSKSRTLKAEIDALLDVGRYDEAAELLHEDLGQTFNEELDNVYGRNLPISGVVRLVPYVFDAGVITTNFDSVIKRCYDDADRSFSEQLIGTRMVELPRYIGTNERFLVKVHGHAWTTSGRVLTKSEYDRAYPSRAEAAAAIEALATRTLLFMGCSLTIDRTMQVLKQVVATQGANNCVRHYAFMEDPGEAGLRQLREEALIACSIHPIWYRNGEHDTSLECLLWALTQNT